MTVRVPFVAEHMAVGVDLNGEGRNLKLGTLIDGMAMRYIRKEGMETGLSGYRKIVDLGTDAKVDSLFGGKSSLTKSLWAKSGTKIFHTIQIDGKAYTVGMTLSAAERNFFLETRNGDVLTFNQTDSPARITAAVLTADTDDDTGAITVGTGTIDKFAASGTVYLRGSPVTYSGKSGGTLTGLSGIPAGGVKTGDLCTQSTTPSSLAIAKGTCGMIVEGATCIAGVKGFENVIYQSAPANLDNPEFAWDFNDNGANASILENPVTAMIKGTTFGYFFGESFCKSTSGYDLTTNVLVINDVTPDFGAYNQYCVANMGGRVVALGKNRLIPFSFFLNSQSTPEAKVDENFDTPIRPWLEEFDTTGQKGSAFLDYDGSKGLLTIGGKINGAFKVRRYDARDGIKAFTPEDVRPARAYTYFDNKSYFGNTATGKVYVDNESLTNDGFPILHFARTGRMEAQKGRKELLLDYIDFDGFMARSTVFTMNFYVNGNFNIPRYTFDLTDSIVTSFKAGKAIGERTHGLFVPGGDPSEGVTFKYPYKTTVDLTGIDCEDIVVEWVCSKLAGYLQVKSFIMEADGIRYVSRDRV